MAKISLEEDTLHRASYQCDVIGLLIYRIRWNDAK